MLRLLQRHSGAWFVAPVLAGFAVLGLGSTWVAHDAVDRMVQRSAALAAAQLSERFAERLDGLPELLRGAPPTVKAQEFITAVFETGAIYRFKLFDAEGLLRHDSRYRGVAAAPSRNLAAHNVTAADIVATGELYFDFKKGDPPNTPDWYSETYAPVRLDGQMVGVIEFYRDETQRFARLSSAMATSFWRVAGVVLIGFLIPSAAFLWRSRQVAAIRERLREAVHYDALTGALNRAALTEFISERIAEADAGGPAVAALFVDLDHFKETNDAHGHGVGDKILRVAADRLRLMIPSDGCVARLGGDEFAACFTYDGEESTLAELGDGVITALSRPLTIDGRAASMSASIGYARHGRDGADVAELLRAADTALARAKSDGRGRAVCYRSVMDAERQERRGIEGALRNALQQDGFELHYQPLIATSGKRLCGFEALLRLNDLDGKPIRPDIFIGIAEQTGMICEIGDWVLREACATAASWPEPLKVAVNLSPAQFEQRDLVEKIQDALFENGLAASRLELEVTENLVIADSDAVYDQLIALKELGVSIALDDFGTGYSSLSHLWRFPFDRLKVDRSFIRNLGPDNAKSREILSTIVALGQVLNLSITAEGVETEEQVAILESLSCDTLQGFLFGRPMPRADADAEIARQTKRRNDFEAA